MRRFPRIVLSLVFFVLATHSSASDLRHLRHVEDASLRSVFFIDDKEGWIVGDEGVILHTIDAGKNWERQPTGLRASLRSVHFLDPYKGWVVGREELPYGMGSAGIVLYTSDGGLEWKRQLPNALPGLNQIRFVDAKTGFMLGDGSDQFPFGVFKTTDAGKSWEPIPGPRTTSWLAADFYDGKSGILAGASSRLATVRTKNATPLEQATAMLIGAWSQIVPLSKDKASLAEHSDWLAGRDITSLQILGAKTLAVGQGGLVLTSTSGGSAWGLPQKILPAEVQANLDFHAVHAVKNKVWIVGRPGSVVVHSEDAGATWTLQKTGQPLPLHGVYFFDEKLGWAVGDAGTVLATTDGGSTWKPQHQAGKRAAAMAIHAQNRDAPIDTLTLLGVAEGYLTTSLRITAPDAATVTWGRSQDARRYAASMRLAGALTGESLWPFPMPQYLEGSDKQTILAHWNKLHAGRADEELIRQLVLSLRIWRPSILLSENPDSKTPLSALVGEAVQEAVRRAADAKAFPEQLGELGLEAWQVRKVYGPCDAKSATITQNNDEPKQRLQATVSDHAAASLALLTERYTPLPRDRSWQLLSAQAASERHWLEGLEQKVGESKRDVKLDDKADDQWMKAIAQRRTAIALAENLDNPAKVLALLPITLDKLPDVYAAPAAFAIGSRFAERGQWYLAQEVYLYLVDRYPADPLAAEAYRWLIRLNTSGEARRRHELKQFAVAPPLGLGKKLPKDKVVQASNKELDLLTSRPETRDWNKGSLEVAKRLSGFGPLYAYDPATQFCLQSAKRQLGPDTAGAARDWLTRFRNYVPDGPWHEAAKAELWLADSKEPAPSRVGRSRFTEVRPFLDGKFDDPCWQGVKPMILGNAVGDTAKDYVTEAMFAHDAEFVYVALKCTHPAGQQVAPVKPRPRDAELEPFDRVSLLFDLDRDRATYYHLEVDQRGCVRDSCWGDKSWNPKWFVAVHSTDTSWQIEAAIPLGELTGERLTQQTAWAFNAVRIVPGRGVQSWSQPADVQPRPEGMSLLLFQSGAGPAMPKAR